MTLDRRPLHELMFAAIDRAGDRRRPIYERGMPSDVREAARRAVAAHVDDVLVHGSGTSSGPVGIVTQGWC